MIDIKKQNKETLKYILNIYDLKESYARQINNMSLLGACNNDGMPHGTDVGNPTQKKAFALLDIEQKKNWIIAIELMEKTLSPKMTKFLELRRDAEHLIIDYHKQGRPSWIDYVQSHYAEWFYTKYGYNQDPHRNTLLQWQSDIVDVTVRIAIAKGCFPM
ncbi:hypothetical protein [Pectinatus frisingensis]|uniref:hypothetical protein n=1 Tax=Pectinatus frisingensis TaxID=865 RepID=UPI0018C74988|nr:hypothetical protein [Pectinatus frisingensis]